MDFFAVWVSGNEAFQYSEGTLGVTVLSLNGCGVQVVDELGFSHVDVLHTQLLQKFEHAFFMLDALVVGFATVQRHEEDRYEVLAHVVAEAHSVLL